MNEPPRVAKTGRPIRPRVRPIDIPEGRFKPERRGDPYPRRQRSDGTHHHDIPIKLNPRTHWLLFRARAWRSYLTQTKYVKDDDLLALVLESFIRKCRRAVEDGDIPPPTKELAAADRRAALWYPYYFGERSAFCPIKGNPEYKPGPWDPYPIGAPETPRPPAELIEDEELGP